MKSACSPAPIQSPGMSCSPIRPESYTFQQKKNKDNYHLSIVGAVLLKESFDEEGREGTVIVGQELRHTQHAILVLVKTEVETCDSIRLDETLLLARNDKINTIDTKSAVSRKPTAVQLGVVLRRMSQLIELPQDRARRQIGDADPPCVDDVRHTIDTGVIEVAPFRIGSRKKKIFRTAVKT